MTPLILQNTTSKFTTNYNGFTILINLRLRPCCLCRQTGGNPTIGQFGYFFITSKVGAFLHKVPSRTTPFTAQRDTSMPTDSSTLWNPLQNTRDTLLNLEQALRTSCSLNFSNFQQCYAGANLRYGVCA